VDAPSVVAKYFPQYPQLYKRAGWTMFQSIDRVYDSTRALRRLGFQCRTGFKEKLDLLKMQLGVGNNP
jgi:UDP-glucose 4-epimerase